MRFIDLPGPAASGGAKISSLGFGCSPLLGRASRRESEQAVAAALDHGITFFDTARSYGYGESEGLLGRMLAARRDRIVICTKFGIRAAQGGWKQWMKPAARAVVRSFPGLRGAAQRQAASQFTGEQFSVAALQESFETSLRELGTEYVDLLLMHAAPVSVLAQDDLLEAMERLVEQGKVRIAGISGEQPVIAEYFEKRPAPLRTAQFALNLENIGFAEETRANPDLLLVANHPFGGPGGDSRMRIAALGADERMPNELREKLSAGDAQVLPEVVLNCILSETGVSAVVPAMVQRMHIESNVRAVESCRFTTVELATLRQVLAAPQTGVQASA
jgi:aryl-alcohol dehydrogenase-like predicted oxidoreductase